MAGVKDIRAAVEAARAARGADGRPTVLFLDEVHRFNKAQQDTFLPYVEDGTLTFIGATTENPSFEVMSALLSRARVYVLRALRREDLTRAAASGAQRRRARPRPRASAASNRRRSNCMARAADGDARRALNMLELAAGLADAAGGERTHHAGQVAQEVASGGRRRFDKGGDQFYDQISALHKAVRGIDPDAALYWLCRMLDGGCDPRYLARRIVRMAIEDIGLADPRAFTPDARCLGGLRAAGQPGRGAGARQGGGLPRLRRQEQRGVRRPWARRWRTSSKYGTLEVPLHLRNAPTRLMKDLGYGRDYRYAHDEPDAFAAGERYLPETCRIGDTIARAARAGDQDRRGARARCRAQQRVERLRSCD